MCYKWGVRVLFIVGGGVGASLAPHHRSKCSPSSSIGSNCHIIKGREHLSMCFFAWSHVMAMEREWGDGRHRGGTGWPPYDRWDLPPLLEAWPTCHEWVWVLGAVCPIGCAAMTRQRSVWCSFRAFDVEPIWDQRWRSLGGPLPWISGVARAGRASSGALVGPSGATKWPMVAYLAPIASSCLIFDVFV